MIPIFWKKNFVLKEREENRCLCSCKPSPQFVFFDHCSLRCTVEWHSLSNRHIDMIMIRASLCICCVNALWPTEDPGSLSAAATPPPEPTPGTAGSLCLANRLTVPMVVTACDTAQCCRPFVDTYWEAGNQKRKHTIAGSQWKHTVDTVVWIYIFVFLFLKIEGLKMTLNICKVGKGDIKCDQIYFEFIFHSSKCLALCGVGGGTPCVIVICIFQPRRERMCLFPTSRLKAYSLEYEAILGSL